MQLRTSLPRRAARGPAPLSNCAQRLPARRAFVRTGCVCSALNGALAELDAALLRGAESEAVALTRSLRDRGVLRGFGSGKLAPKREYSLVDLRLHNIRAEMFLSPRDSTLETIRTQALLALALGGTAFAYAHPLDTAQLLFGGLAVAAASAVDAIGFGGALEALALDSLGRAASSSYRGRVLRHEAGHLLVAYLLGVVPTGYTLSAAAALREGRPATQAGCRFADAEFTEEVARGSLSSASLDAFACVALAGVCAEYEAFAQAEGGLGDVRSLDSLLSALGFTQKKADSVVRFAVLSVVLLLRREVRAHDALAAAMEEGRSVADCLSVVEANLSGAVEEQTV